MASTYNVETTCLYKSTICLRRCRSSHVTYTSWILTASVQWSRRVSFFAFTVLLSLCWMSFRGNAMIMCIRESSRLMFIHAVGNLRFLLLLLPLCTPFIIVILFTPISCSSYSFSVLPLTLFNSGLSLRTFLSLLCTGPWQEDTNACCRLLWGHWVHCYSRPSKSVGCAVYKQNTATLFSFVWQSMWIYLAINVNLSKQALKHTVLTV